MSAEYYVLHDLFQSELLKWWEQQNPQLHPMTTISNQLLRSNCVNHSFDNKELSVLGLIFEVNCKVLLQIGGEIKDEDAEVLARFQKLLVEIIFIQRELSMFFGHSIFYSLALALPCDVAKDSSFIDLSLVELARWNSEILLCSVILATELNMTAPALEEV